MEDDKDYIEGYSLTPICVHAHAHTHACAHTHALIRAHAHTYTHTHIDTHAHIVYTLTAHSCTHTHTGHSCTHTHKGTHVHTHAAQVILYPSKGLQAQW